MGSWGFMRQSRQKPTQPDEPAEDGSRTWQSSRTAKPSIPRRSSGHRRQRRAERVQGQSDSQCPREPLGHCQNVLWTRHANSCHNSVVPLVDKGMDGGFRARYEIPTVGMAMWGWRLEPFLRRRLSPFSDVSRDSMMENRGHRSGV